MSLTSIIIINIYSIAILSVIGYHSLRLAERGLLKNKIYNIILYLTIVLLILDIFSRLEGKAHTIFPLLNAFGNFLTFLLIPFVPSLWLIYVSYQIYQDKGKIGRLICPILVINAVLVVLSQFYGWYYYIDENNIYHRGPFFLGYTGIIVGLVFVGYILTIKNRHRLEKKIFLSLLFIPVFPLVCFFMQVAYYGVSVALKGLVISLLVIFLGIQNHNIYIDYLTGVNNRKRLERHLKKKINGSSPQKGFSAILLDIDNFKEINDQFGHDMGDRALEDAVKLIRSSVRENDFIARYGGDEFVVILDICKVDDLEEIISRIDQCVEKSNELALMPYKINFSMGYAVYDYHSHMNGDEFIKHLDALMYENKQRIKMAGHTV